MDFFAIEPNGKKSALFLQSYRLNIETNYKRNQSKEKEEKEEAERIIKKSFCFFCQGDKK